MAGGDPGRFCARWMVRPLPSSPPRREIICLKSDFKQRGESQRYYNPTMPTKFLQVCKRQRWVLGAIYTRPVIDKYSIPTRRYLVRMVCLRTHSIPFSSRRGFGWRRIVPGFANRYSSGRYQLGLMETITKLPLLLQSPNFMHDFVSPPRRTLAKYGFVVLPRPA